MVWPGRACATTAAQAARNAVRSGARCLSTGVGTQISTVSASAISLIAVVRRRAGSAACSVSRSRSWSSSSRSARPARMSSSRAGAMSTPITRDPLATRARLVGRPT